MKRLFTLFGKFTITIFLASIFVFKSNKLSADWSQSGSFGSLHNDVSAIIRTDNFIFAGTLGSGVMRSSDNGLSWTEANGGHKILYVKGFTCNSSGLFACGAGGVFFSPDPGGEWTAVGKGSTTSLVVSLTSKNENVYAGCGLAGVFRTTNNGSTWERFALGEGDKMNAVIYTDEAFFLSIHTAILKTTNEGKTFNSASFGIYPDNAEMFTYYENDMYAGALSGVYYSSNSGDLWNKVNNGLTDTNITSVTNAGEVVFAGSKEGRIFCSVNRGQVWTDVSQGIADSTVTSLCSDGQYLFAGTAKGNVWKRPLSEMITSITSQTVTVAGTYVLHQNYPNPFNPVTKISFDLPYAGKVKLKIYDSNGKEIAVLIDESLTGGNHNLSFNAGVFSSGVYIYRLEAGNISLSRKMLLIK